MVFERIFLGFWRGFGGQNGCQNQFWECFLRCFFGGQLGIDFLVFLKVFFKVEQAFFLIPDSEPVLRQCHETLLSFIGDVEPILASPNK